MTVAAAQPQQQAHRKRDGKQGEDHEQRANEQANPRDRQKLAILRSAVNRAVL